MSHLIKLKNASGNVNSWAGKEFVIDEEYTVPTDANRAKWQNNSGVLVAIANSDLLVGDGGEFFSDVNQALDWLKGNISAKVEVVKSESLPPFANKVTSDDKKLYRRKHGISLDSPATVIAAGETKTLSLVVPYNNAKINKIEIIGGKIGDTVDLKVYDTPTGTLSTVPNYMLNQFGFSVYVGSDFYEDSSNYDADLIKDMKIELSYSNNHDSDDVVPYANIVLHEVK